jgi:hypothetical protein
MSTQNVLYPAMLALKQCATTLRVVLLLDFFKERHGVSWHTLPATNLFLFAHDEADNDRR